jgi:hypothetical protein
MVSELRIKAQIRETFGNYVDQRIVAGLIDRPELTDAKGSRREMTISFCDMKGFTSFSEDVTPAALNRPVWPASPRSTNSLALPHSCRGCSTTRSFSNATLGKQLSRDARRRSSTISNPQSRLLHFPDLVARIGSGRVSASASTFM